MGPIYETFIDLRTVLNDLGIVEGGLGKWLPVSISSKTAALQSIVKMECSMGFMNGMCRT